MHRITLAALLLLLCCATLGCGAISRAQYALDADNALNVHPADASEVEPRRNYQGPGESTTSNLWVPGTVSANWDYYIQAYKKQGWKVSSGSELPSKENGHRANLNLQRGFEHIWIDMTQIDGTRIQAQTHFDVEQPTDFLSRMLQAGWDNLFHFLPADNPIRAAKFIF